MRPPPADTPSKETDVRIGTDLHRRRPLSNGRLAACLILTFATLIANARLAGARGQAVSPIQNRVVDHVKLRMVVIDLNDPRVRVGVETARGFPHRSEEFLSMVHRVQPIVAVNGNFFSEKTNVPVGDVVIDGHKIHEGNFGTAIAITHDNQVAILRVWRDRTYDWTGYETVLACGPALVLNRRIDVDPKAEHFHDPHIMRATRRLGVAMLLGHRLALVTTTTPVTFQKFARVLYDLGATDAMNLDAGASLAMFYKGKTVIKPHRKIADILTVRVDGE
jgi:uncharacterized protein YigE (DUF2233 family)